MRPIDADAIIQAVCTKLGIKDKKFLLQSEKAIVDVILNAPTIEVPKWIPCSERLPEEETECLVTDSHGRIRHCVKDKCGNYEFATYEEYMHIGAIAWMPLPKPYEETDHE